MAAPTRLLFVCHAHTVLSPMAEGLARAAFGDLDIRVRSAGLRPKAVDPRAIAALAEIGIDISDIVPTSVRELDLDDFNIVVSLGMHKLGLQRGQIAVAWDLRELGVAHGAAAIEAVRDLRARITARVRSLRIILGAAPRA